MFWTKEQGNTPKELSEMHIINQLNQKFKAMIVKMFKEFGKWLDEQNETLEDFSKDYIKIDMKKSIMKLKIC